ADMQNDIQSFSTDYCVYFIDDDLNGNFDAGEQQTGYGPCDNAPDESFQTHLMKWDTYMPNTKEMDEMTGFFSFLVGGYLPHHNNIRIELEWTQHNDFDYRDERLYVGYPIYVGPDIPGGIQSGDLDELDDEMETQFKSTVSSSHFMLRVLYDFTEKGRNIGDWTPFVGVGLGLATNITNLTLIDPQNELTQDDSPFYNIEGGIIDREIEHQNFAWGLSIGINYALSEHLSFDVGLNYTDLGLIEWGFDEANTLLKSDKLTATDVFLGFRFDF
ncbi:MAG: outer membrane protein, partial [Alphaproteobacteria bacterium]